MLQGAKQRGLAQALFALLQTVFKQDVASQVDAPAVM